MPTKKKPKITAKKEAEVLDSYDSWLKKRPVKKARAIAGDMSEDEKKA